MTEVGTDANGSPTMELPKAETKTPEPTPEQLFDAIAQSHMMRAFERLTAVDVKAGDTLIFKFTRQLPHNMKINLVKNFDAVLAKNKLRGFFIPADVDFQGVLATSQMVGGSVLTMATKPKDAEEANGN